MNALVRFVAPHYVAGAELDRTLKRCVRTARMTAHYADGHEITWNEVEAGLL